MWPIQRQVSHDPGNLQASRRRAGQPRTGLGRLRPGQLRGLRTGPRSKDNTRHRRIGPRPPRGRVRARRAEQVRVVTQESEVSDRCPSEGARLGTLTATRLCPSTHNPQDAGRHRSTRPGEQSRREVATLGARCHPLATFDALGHAANALSFLGRFTCTPVLARSLRS
jgi:hypothetical protein